MKNRLPDKKIALLIIISLAFFLVMGNYLVGQSFFSYTQAETEAKVDIKTIPKTEIKTAEASLPKTTKQVLGGPLIALTFDDGPSKTVTPVLLKELRKRGVVVTFFVLGNRAEKYSNIVLEAYQDGNQIAIHGYDHKYKFTTLSDKDLLWQVDTAEDIVETITGQRPSAVRPPYGAINITTAAKIDIPCVLWNVDTRDWASRNADKVANHIVSHAKDGSIIILHDTFSTSVQGAIKAIDILSAKGYKFVTIDQLFAAESVQFVSGTIYPEK